MGAREQRARALSPRGERDVPPGDARRDTPSAPRRPRAGGGQEGVRGGAASPDGGEAGAPDTAREARRRSLLLSYTAFDASHHPMWLRYTRARVGSDAMARRIVEDACRHLLEHWQHALRQSSLSEYAWTVLKDHIAGALRERGRSPYRPAYVAAFERALREGLLAELREEYPEAEGEFAQLERIGLHAACTRLPERQYDAVVLRYVLGYGHEQAADCMGCDVATVRTHLRYAKGKLALELNAAPEDGT